MCISVQELRRELLPLLPSRGPMWPHDLEAEAIVLGHLATSGSVDESVARLESKDFFGHSHGGIFEVLRHCRGEDMDPPTQYEFLEAAGTLKFGNLDSRDFDTITRSVPTIIKVEPYVEKVRELSWIRSTLYSLRSLDSLLRSCKPEMARSHFYGWLNDQ